MVKWILAYLVIGVIIEIGCGIYAGYYEDKMGLGDMSLKDGNRMLDIFLRKNGSMYYKFLMAIPFPLDMIIGNAASIIFWPIHSIWLNRMHVKAVNSFKAFYEYETKYLSQNQEEP